VLAWTLEASSPTAHVAAAATLVEAAKRVTVAQQVGAHQAGVTLVEVGVHPVGAAGVVVVHQDGEALVPVPEAEHLAGVETADAQPTVEATDHGLPMEAVMAREQPMAVLPHTAAQRPMAEELHTAAMTETAPHTVASTLAAAHLVGAAAAAHQEPRLQSLVVAYLLRRPVLTTLPLQAPMRPPPQEATAHTLLLRLVDLLWMLLRLVTTLHLPQEIHRVVDILPLLRPVLGTLRHQRPAAIQVTTRVEVTG